jgi:hypothetical protein
MHYLRMNNISKFLMPISMDDGRLDGYIEIISAIRAGKGVELSFKNQKK